MANPNIVNVATINGKTDVFALTTTETNLITATANAADVTIKYNDGSNDRAIASTISVPADATLELINKNSGFYLEETEIIKGTASANSDLECLISYEVISD